MTLSCFLKRIYSPLTGSVLGGLNKKLAKPSCSVFIIRQPYHQNLIPSEYKCRKLSSQKCTWTPVSLLGNPKQFSTSSALLASHKGHDHSKLWTFERLLSFSLLPLLPAALIYPSQPLDTALALIIVLHTHFGLEAIVVDYIRPILFGEIIPKIGLGLLYLFSIVTLAGLLNLIYNDTGLANTIITIWKK